MTPRTGGTTGTGVIEGYARTSNFNEFSEGKSDEISFSRKGDGEPIVMISKPSSREEAENVKKELNDRLDNLHNWGHGGGGGGGSTGGSSSSR